MVKPTKPGGKFTDPFDLVKAFNRLLQTLQWLICKAFGFIYNWHNGILSKVPEHHERKAYKKSQGSSKLWHKWLPRIHHYFCPHLDLFIGKHDCKNCWICRITETNKLWEFGADFCLYFGKMSTGGAEYFVYLHGTLHLVLLTTSSMSNLASSLLISS